ncbi:Retrovirus-related Pol polyprotein from transposon RE2 [Senna tora]|uniref:Retrovirus-related Pol polyprotein from transposon RE2 n=1 Tax=Senna tora TaxID=362788 RepID=A0A834WM59_9FABA|nr:Retrovirus-related Pol polyprotein from transposon RE2 [Senna tora]
MKTPMETNYKSKFSQESPLVDSGSYQRTSRGCLLSSKVFEDSSWEGNFFKNSNRGVEIYMNTNWAGYVIDKRSTSRYCTFVWGNLGTWRSKKQLVVARSSAEEEFRVYLKAYVKVFGWPCGMNMDEDFEDAPISFMVSKYCLTSTMSMTSPRHILRENKHAVPYPSTLAWC